MVNVILVTLPLLSHVQVIKQVLFYNIISSHDCGVCYFHITLSTEIQVLACGVWFQKLTVSSPRRGPPPTHPSGNSSQASNISLNFWAFESPPPPRNFQSLLWGEYGYFLELHNKDFIVISVVVNPEIREPQLIKVLH